MGGWFWEADGIPQTTFREKAVLVHGGVIQYNDDMWPKGNHFPVSYMTWKFTKWGKCQALDPEAEDWTDKINAHVFWTM